MALPQPTIVTLRCTQCNLLHESETCPYTVPGIQNGWTLGPRLRRIDDIAWHEAHFAGNTAGVAVVHHGDEKAQDIFRRRSRLLASIDLPGATVVDSSGSLRRRTPFRVDAMSDAPGLQWWLRRGTLTNQDIFEIGSKLCYLLDALHRLGAVHGALKPRTVRASRRNHVWEVELNGFAPLDRAPKVDVRALGLLMTLMLGGQSLARGFEHSAAKALEVPSELRELLVALLDPESNPAGTRQLLDLGDAFARARVAPVAVVSQAIAG